MSKSLEKKKRKGNPVSGPSGREHPHVKYSLLLLIVLVTSQQTQRKINLILVTYQFLKK